MFEKVTKNTWTIFQKHLVESDEIEVLLMLKNGIDLDFLRANKKYIWELAINLDKYGLDTSSLLFSAMDIDTQFVDGNTLLSLAIKWEMRQLAADLITLGANPDIRNTKGETTLHVAVRSNFFVDRIIACGADINTCITGTHKNPLWIAIESHRMYALERLIRVGVDLSQPNDIGLTPMEYAEKYNSSYMPYILRGMPASVAIAGVAC